MAEGWVKVDRAVQDHWLWKEQPFSTGQAWIDLIMIANHADNTIQFDGKPLVVERGSMVTSIRKLSERWGWSRKKVGRFLDVLERDSMLSQNRATKRTTITLVNYSKFQDAAPTKEPQKSHRRATEEPHAHTNKNDKNVKNEKKKSGSAAVPSEQKKPRGVSDEDWAKICELRR